MKFSDFEQEGRRLELLRALEHAVHCTANAYLLRRYCEAVGYTVLADDLTRDLAWLASKKLIDLVSQQGVQVATLTARGLDVANGLAYVAGVRRPKPGV